MPTVMTKLPSDTLADWEAIRALYNLDRDYTHLGASQFVASHPRPVREAIDKHRRELDSNPVLYIMEHEQSYAQKGRIAAARYLRMDDPDNIALTTSTTMGLGTIYTGLNIRGHHEILTTEHNYYSQQEAANRAKERTGALLREVTYYENIHEVTQEEMVHNIVSQIRDNTRVVGTTWVHSDTGLKSPIAKISKEIDKINKSRDEDNRIIFLVDGVHGFGIETDTFDELGCDFLIAGCHKWLYGPRGTGLVAGKKSAWQHVYPVIPCFSELMWDIIKGGQQPNIVNGPDMSPGGFHALEHYWALPSAFEYCESIGKDVIYQRVHELNRLCKEGLASMSHVNLATPIDDDLSAGIISFEVKGLTVKETVDRLIEKKVIATVAPYEKSYARFTPGIYNTPEEIQLALDAVQSLKQ